MHDQEGATAVEFSLIATLLFMLLFGILHFGLAYNRQQGLHAAAREGARLASLGGDVTDALIIQRVKTAAPAFVREDDLDVLIAPEDPSDPHACHEAGDTVSVTVSLKPGTEDRYQAKIPGLAAFTPDLTVQATFMCETARA